MYSNHVAWLTRKVDGDDDLWQVSITPMSDAFRVDRDSDSAPESDKGNGGKEGL